jgi:hypothetical protein
VGNHVTIVGNGSANVINISNLVSVAGVINVRDNNAATVVDLASVRSIGGDVIIVGNGAAIVIDLRQVGSVGGDLTISSNAPSATTDLSSLTTVGGGTNTATVLLQQGAFVFTNGFTVPTNATLAGHGTLAGSVTNSGTISPGASPGRFQLTGNLILAPNSQLRFELAGSAPAQADFLSVAGGVTLGGTLSVTLINSAPVSLVDGASFTLITAGSAINGAFANVPSGGALTTADGFARFTAQYAGQTSVQLAGLVSLDTDGDSLSNAREQAAGTDPANPLSVFRILSLVSEPGGVRLTWSTVGGRSYVVQTNDRLTGPFADFGLPIAVPGAGESTTNLLDAAALPGVSRFYRVRLGP